MKKIFLVLSLVLLSFITCAQPSQALSPFIGDSWARGVVGLEYQYSKYAVSIGYIPAKLPTGQRINCISVATTYYLKTWDYSCPYVTLGYASEGFIGTQQFKIDQSGVVTTQYNIVPSYLLVAGYKFRLENAVNFKVGLGASVSDEGGRLEFDLQLAVPIFKNKNHYDYDLRRNPYEKRDPWIWL